MRNLLRNEIGVTGNPVLIETNPHLGVGVSRGKPDRITPILNILIISCVLLFMLLVWKSQEARLNAYSEWYCSVIYGKNPDCSGNYTYSEGVNKND